MSNSRPIRVVLGSIAWLRRLSSVLSAAMVAVGLSFPLLSCGERPQSARLCVVSNSELISSDVDLARAEIVHVESRDWAQWDRELFSAIVDIKKGLVALSELQAGALERSGRFELFVAPSFAMKARSGSIIVGVALCPRGERSKCRNRTYFVRPHVEAKTAAVAIMDDALSDKKRLADCELRASR